MSAIYGGSHGGSLYYPPPLSAPSDTVGKTLAFVALEHCQVREGGNGVRGDQ